MVEIRDNKRTGYGLLSAVAVANAALGVDPSVRTLRTAARSLDRELGKIAGDDTLWEEIRSFAEASEFQASNLPRDALRLIGDVFIGTLATQLAIAGWHYPPSPSAGEMIEETQTAFRFAASRWRRGHSLTGRVENAQLALQRFASTLQQNLKSTDPKLLRRLVSQARRIGTKTLLALDLAGASVEVTTGDNFDAVLGLPTSGVSIKFVIPAPWHSDLQADRIHGLIVAAACADISAALDPSDLFHDPKEGANLDPDGYEYQPG
jgi:hypothetical protein